jgi:hypothetical protein
VNVRLKVVRDWPGHLDHSAPGPKFPDKELASRRCSAVNPLSEGSIRLRRTYENDSQPTAQSLLHDGSSGHGNHTYGYWKTHQKTQITKEKEKNKEASEVFAEVSDAALRELLCE